MSRREEFINKVLELFKEGKITVIYTTIVPNREVILIRDRNNDSEPHVSFWRMQANVCMCTGGKWINYSDAYEVVKDIGDLE